MTYCERLKKEAAQQQATLWKKIKEDEARRIVKQNVEAWPALKKRFPNLTRIERPGEEDLYETCGYQFTAGHDLYKLYQAERPYVLKPTMETYACAMDGTFSLHGICDEYDLGRYLLLMSQPQKRGFFARLFNL
jgi:hypothetical protein